MFDAKKKTGDGLSKKVQLAPVKHTERRLSRTGFRVSDKIGSIEKLRRLSFSAPKLKLVTLLLKD